MVELGHLAHDRLGQLEQLRGEMLSMEGRLREHTRTSVGGRHGEGFTVAWVGVLIATVGTVLGAL